MAKNQVQTRPFSAGGKAYRITREGSIVTVINQDNGGRTEYEYKTRAEARRVMNNPGIIVK